MITYKSTIPATVTEPITIHTIINPDDQQPVQHYGYRALLNYVRKPPEERLILCSSLEEVETNETVFVNFHTGMRLYQHNRYTTVSDCDHCAGGFYFLNGTPA